VSTPSASESPPIADQTRWFAEEVHAHEPLLRNYLKGQFPAVRDVDDVIQESFLRVWQRQAIKPIASAKAFLFKVGRHLALDTLRHERRSPIQAVSDLSGLGVIEEKADAAESAAHNEEVTILMAAIESLPGRCREIYILRKLYRLPQKEIAERLGVTEGTVQVQIGRANRRCEEFFRARGYAPGPRA
jgi:RNA polymerase sigma factor (sigma-70 family)